MIPSRGSLIPWLALLFSVVCKICVHVYNVFIFLLSATAVYRGAALEISSYVLIVPWAFAELGQGAPERDLQP